MAYPPCSSSASLTKVKAVSSASEPFSKCAVPCRAVACCVVVVVCRRQTYVFSLLSSRCYLHILTHIYFAAQRNHNSTILACAPQKNTQYQPSNVPSTTNRIEKDPTQYIIIVSSSLCLLCHGQLRDRQLLHAAAAAIRLKRNFSLAHRHRCVHQLG